MIDDSLRDGNSFSKNEFDIIYEEIEQSKIKKVLEIGTYQGYITFGLYDLVIERNKGEIVSVDTLDATEGWDANEHSEIYYKNKAYIEQNNLKNVTLLVSGSDAFFSSNQEKFDCILIDGDHSYMQVKRDLANSLNAIVNNGIIILHDFNKPDIRNCVDEIDSSQYITTVVRGVGRILILKVINGKE